MAFTKATTPASRLVVAVWGDAKVGKTHFALTFPAPIRVLNLDFGLQEILPRFSPKDIAWSDQPMTDNKNLAQGQKLLQEFHADYLAAIEECQDGGTVVIDTATQLWQIIQTVKLHEVRARRGAAKGKDADEVKPLGFDYQEANNLMGNSVLRRVLQKPNLNACFIHRAKNAYSDGGERLSRLEFHGFAETPSIAQITMQITGPGAATINYCRFDPAMAGTSHTDLDYDLLRELVLP